MRSTGRLLGFGLGALGIGLAFAVGRRRQERRIASRVDTLRTIGSVAGDGPVDLERVDALPDPIRRYLTTVLDREQRPVGGVRIDQRGSLRIGGPDSAWHSFTASQHVVTEPTGFLWNARVRLAPAVWATVLDEYRQARGSGQVRLWSVVPVGGADPCPELNEAALMRYLAEAVWYPTALLPSAGVEWEPIDDRSARATVEDGRTTASLVFHVNGADEVERVSTEGRYRRVRGGFEPTPWTGRWAGYRTIDGVRVPTVGDVYWHLPDGDLHAWHGRVTRYASLD